MYITKDFSIINENNYKLIDRVFDLEPTAMDLKAKVVHRKHDSESKTDKLKKK